MEIIDLAVAHVGVFRLGKLSWELLIMLRLGAEQIPSKNPEAKATLLSSIKGWEKQI